MVFTRIIREPQTQMDAEMEFARQVHKAGYVITSPIMTRWQLSLFSNLLDAVVHASVEKPERRQYEKDADAV